MGEKEDRTRSADGSRADGGPGAFELASGAKGLGAESGPRPSDDVHRQDRSSAPGESSAAVGARDRGDPQGGRPSEDSSWEDSGGAADGNSEVVGSATTVVAGAGAPTPSIIIRHFASAPAFSWPQVGERMGGRFELRGEIGRGRFGRVYEAWDDTLKAPVAVKVVRTDDVADFLGDAGPLARVRAPNVVSVIDAGAWLPWGAWLATELLDGASLQKVIADRASERRPFEPNEAVEILLDVLAGLSRVHAEGLVHRDLKPANVFILASGSAKVLDFGLAASVACQGAEGSFGVAGTPSYMAPEQWRGAPPATSMDVWAAGAVLVELLTGEPPYHGVTAQSGVDGLRSAVLGPGPVPSVATLRKGLPGALVQAVDQALRKDPRERFDSAVTFRAALVKVLPQLTRGSSKNPFRFLEAFTVDDKEWFCGRRTLVAELMRHLDGAPFVALVGPSGAGKTSVVQAGLFPALQQSNPALFLNAFRPGESEHRQRLATFQAPPDGAGLLFVDQLEELFAPRVPDDERAAVLSALVRLAAAPGQWKIAVAMRHDRMDVIGSHAGFKKRFESHIKLVGPPTHVELAETIRVPAERCGWVIEAGLAERMVTRLDRETAPLPLLQLAASVLWEKAEQEGTETITATHLEALGDLEGIVGTRADKTLAELGSEQERGLARDILLALVRDGRRRQAPRGELLSECPDAAQETAERVLDKLVQQRLVTTSRVETGGVHTPSSVELAHDLLIDRWPTLKGWLSDNAKQLDVRDRATRAAELWHQDGRAKDRLWTRADLKDGVAWRANWRGHVHPLVRDFLAASQRRDRQGARIVAALVTLVSAGLLAAALVSTWQWREAAQARDAAEASAAQANAERGAAERLVSHIVYDLRDKLVPLGQLALMDGAMSAVRAYYDSTPIRGAGTGESARLAAIAQAGDVLLAQGRLAKALDAYETALRGQRALSASDPSNEGWKRDVTVSLDRVADVRLAQGEADKALALYQESLDLSRALSASDPSNAGWKGDVTVSLIKVADVRLAQGEADKALALFQESLDLSRALSASDPSNANWRDDLGISDIRVTLALAETGRADEAITHGVAAVLSFAHAVTMAPSVVAYQDHLNAGLSALSDPLALVGRTVGERALRTVADGADDLREQGPDAWRRVRATAAGLAMDVLHAPALALEFGEAVRAAFPTDATVVCNHAEATLAAGRPYAEARRELEACFGLSAEEPGTMVAARALSVVAAVEARETRDARAAARALRAALGALGSGRMSFRFGGSRAALETRGGPHAPGLIRLLTALEDSSPDERARGVEAALAALGLATGH